MGKDFQARSASSWPVSSEPYWFVAQPASKAMGIVSPMQVDVMTGVTGQLGVRVPRMVIGETAVTVKSGLLLYCHKFTLEPPSHSTHHRC